MEYGLVVASEEQLAKMKRKDLIACVRHLYSISDRDDKRIASLQAEVEKFKGMLIVHDSYRAILIELSVPKSFVQR